MDQNVNRWVRAKVVLLPREDGKVQRPTYLFTGYRCSTLRFDHPKHDLPIPHPYVTRAIFHLDGQNLVPVGQVVDVTLDLYLGAPLADELYPDAQFSLYEVGRRVVSGVITEVLDSSPNP